MRHNSTNVRIIKGLARVSSVVSPRLAARLLERLFLTPSRWPMPARQADWMVGAERIDVCFDDERQLPIYSWGSGPVVLLVHGWSGRGSQLGAYIEPLVERGFRVVTFDAPGHGEADGRMTGLPEMAAAIERVARRVGPIDAIVAHSLGAAAMTIALSRGLSVGRAIYIAPPENPGEFLKRAARYLGFSDAVERLTRARIEKRFGFAFASARGSLLAPKLDVPLLTIHDVDDTEVLYDAGVRLAKAWPGAELVAAKGLGHHRIVWAPDVVEAAVGFLSRDERLARLGSQNLETAGSVGYSVMSEHGGV